VRGCNLTDAVFEEVLSWWKDESKTLRAVDASDNYIASLNQKTIADCGIKELIVSSNVIQSLPDGLQLEKIDVSFNRLDTSETRLPRGLLTDGGTANLAGNAGIDFIDTNFAVQNRINRIDLTGSSVKCLNWRANMQLEGPLPDWVASLAMLEEIDVSDTRITSLPTGVFSGSKSSLRTINLGSCERLEELDDEVFQDLAAVTSLNLEKTSLQALPDKVFEDMTSLEELGLKGLQLKNLTKNMFTGCGAVEEIDMSNQGIAGIGHYAFHGAEGIKTLKVNGNPDTKSVQAQAFHGLTQLTTLEVDYTMLVEGGVSFDRGRLEAMKASLKNLVVYVRASEACERSVRASEACERAKRASEACETHG
jgi:Leucine-rich repeat (LRR) protein